MVSTFQLTRTVKLCLTHQISPIKFKICLICVICGSASSSKAVTECRRAEEKSGEKTEEQKCLGRGVPCDTSAPPFCSLLSSKVRSTGLKDAHPFENCAVLENADDSFEDRTVFQGAHVLRAKTCLALPPVYGQEAVFPHRRKSDMPRSPSVIRLSRPELR